MQDTSEKRWQNIEYVKELQRRGGKKYVEHSDESHPSVVAFKKEVERGERDARVTWDQWRRGTEWLSRYQCLKRSRQTALKATIRRLRGGSGAFTGSQAVVPSGIDVTAIGCLTAAQAAAVNANALDASLREQISESADLWAKEKCIEERGAEIAAQRVSAHSVEYEGVRRVALFISIPQKQCDQNLDHLGLNQIMMYFKLFLDLCAVADNLQGVEWLAKADAFLLDRLRIVLRWRDFTGEGVKAIVQWEFQRIRENMGDFLVATGMPFDHNLARAGRSFKKYWDLTLVKKREDWREEEYNAAVNEHCQILIKHEKGEVGKYYQTSHHRSQVHM
uniref:Uncharacterized protein n=1 Tax=Chromera velia CCMP2878 TaxID=1169474 RepID=A0A0G4G1G5_9ALVE|eukprot:Cvel_4035.t1-p1 / transcript=Cvel_4035.t1 / gene=Cvel_4035 / organism=Chromera_velia_CCMP2878 / gene_product=hypothetical protein / transcript_product=hypothetical protein / location=Cvel_scaffold171:100973-102095(-) / protein_length=333 / sequence_SO=supercontig / SO=protein_coding / is_pseudo=false